jgi:transcription antitermination factor NusG
MKVWMIATFKINELKRLKENLQNQDLEYYHPKINTKKYNLILKDEPLFPGYIFIYSEIENYSKIKFTRGISKVIRFNNNIATLEDDEIIELKKIESESYSQPIIQQIHVGQEAIMSEGPLKGSFITIASLPNKDRVNIFIHILGKRRKVTTSLDEIKL